MFGGVGGADGKLHLFEEELQVFGGGGGEFGFGAVAVGVGHAVDFGAGLAAAGGGPSICPGLAPANTSSATAGSAAPRAALAWVKR